jgi:hypothetical protein
MNTLQVIAGGIINSRQLNFRLEYFQTRRTLDAQFVFPEPLSQYEVPRSAEFHPFSLSYIRKVTRRVQAQGIWYGENQLQATIKGLQV